MTRLLLTTAVLFTTLPPSVLRAQAVHRDEFLRWAHDRAHPIGIPGRITGPEGFSPLRTIVADARVVALGEPLHGFQEPLLLRNEVIEYFVKELGFTAVALGTGLASSKRLHDYVAGGAGETDAASRLL
jgi:erythromycin esterase